MEVIGSKTGGITPPMPPLLPPLQARGRSDTVEVRILIFVRKRGRFGVAETE
jgi:hypothetical protein